MVLCQQGLQFFPDKPAALRDMRRVLMPTGHVVLSVWRHISHCPWQRALADALERHVRDEFVPGYLSATPVAGIIAKLVQPTRAAILQEVKTSLQPYVDDDGLAAPIEAHALVANQ